MTGGLEYKNVIRIANKNDCKKNTKNVNDALKAVVKCNELIEQYKKEKQEGRKFLTCMGI